MDFNQILEGLNNRNYAVSQRPGEKSDPDLSEEERSVIEKYQPQHVLIVYGTLGPGRPNHNRIEHIQGQWKKATIRGKLEAKGWGADLGFYGFVNASTEQETDIEAFVLFSDQLTMHWKLLDDFEGEEYIRVLAKFTLENGEEGVGNLYALKNNH